MRSKPKIAGLGECHRLWGAMASLLNRPGIGSAFVAVALLAVGSFCSVVALSCEWWQGAVGATAFAGLASAQGGLSLWKFVGRSVVLGVSLPSVSLDSSVLCGGDFQVQIQEEICSGIHTTRGFVNAAVCFSIVATLAALISVVALLNCGGALDPSLGARLLLPCSGLATAAAGLMIAAMIMGAVAGHGMGLGDFGTLSYAMGAGVYGAIFQIITVLLGAALAASARSSLSWKSLPHADEPRV
ncbi:unnamed protein product [Symbiodinium microadriaticum]|nr:unnamed protein product [Symbiodinium microadriaticum]